MTIPKRRGFLAVRVCAAILLFGHVAGSQSGETYKVRLTPVPIDATTMARIAGSGSATAVLNGTKLTITGTFDGLRSPATVAKIHRAFKGIRGPAILDLTVSKGTTGTISGSAELTPGQVEDLRNARLYIQIYSERAPEGNLWGWLLR
jgi:CHRD domain-containing protein